MKRHEYFILLAFGIAVTWICALLRENYLLKIEQAEIVSELTALRVERKWNIIPGNASASDSLHR
jgi:hypothetical protein